MCNKLRNLNNIYLAMLLENRTRRFQKIFSQSDFKSSYHFRVGRVGVKQESSLVLYGVYQAS